MTVYALRQGFYRELLGIYTTEEKAWEAARQEHAEDGGTPESFGREEYEVHPVQMDQEVSLW